MIYGKKIEEAARKYAFNKYDSTDDKVEDTYTEELQMAFETGIDWFLDSLWHDASEEPERNKDVCLEMIGYEQNKFYGVIDSSQVDSEDWDEFCKGDQEIIRWFYIDDLVKGANNG